ncbi:germin [Artemisia annua]|uniref:Germin-like protein n=1 Tax=Artemisia annua TaxID=35608 RepID=A0A2U1N8J6_ARTAN|nr:germin [Artemisia annua]
MASELQCFLLLLMSSATLHISMAGDPDILSDFILPATVSYVVLKFPNGTINPPHTHPSASELFFVLMGSLEVGFVDTTNKLFTQTLQKGDIYVFPKGLVHFRFNSDAQDPALAFFAFDSVNAGTVSVPNSVFCTTIDDQVLDLSFKTDVTTIQKIKSGLSS